MARTAMRSQKKGRLQNRSSYTGGWRLIQKILVATDGSDHARKAIEIASDIALKYGANLVLLHVVDVVTQRRMAAYMEDMENYLSKVGEKILREAEEDARKKGVRSMESRLIEGDPASKIVEFARKSKVDVIIMGRRGTGLLETLVLGSVSHRVCHLAKCTCMTVK